MLGVFTLLTTGIAQGQALFVTSATVQNPGDSAQICVMFSSNGRQVAGTQNDLVWDGTCATLTDPPPCATAGSHGKQLSKAILSNTSFAFRGIVLSFSDTSPIPDGPLYCCSFEGEANPGACCPITITNALGSEPGGVSVPLSGNTAQICTAQGSGQSGGAVGSIGGMNPPSASNQGAAGAPASAAANPAAAPAAPAGGAPAPPVQVLPGGGVRVENPAAEAGAPPNQTPALAPTPGSAAAASSAGAAAPPAAAVGAPTAAAPRAPAAAATAAPAAPPTSRPTAADTPTVPAPGAPTIVPTKAAAATAKPQAAAPPPDTGSHSGLFGCQIAEDPSVAPLAGFGLLVLAGWAIGSRRAESGKRTRDPRTQR